MWKIERLGSAHVRDQFACGKPVLDKFIREQASQYERRDMGRTFVATLPPEPVVLAYYTLAAGSVQFEAWPADERRKLPHHPIPVAHLGRLAVDQRARGQRLGETMLMDALHRCVGFAHEIGILAVELYAIDEDARRFYLKYGFISLADDQLHLYLTMKTVRKLFAGDVQ
jgi:GNAT superfamily N-acetyltransferase